MLSVADVTDIDYLYISNNSSENNYKDKSYGYVTNSYNNFTGNHITNTVSRSNSNENNCDYDEYRHGNDCDNDNYL